ncbi:DUF1659 domain-containing protein [Aquibacillus koreensis]|uniref:DUF1659 domain-containing protein n=1 Tax=Aquibacillus koreensis TaxID=279446 RepID=A0A9X3WJW0_9BACI|nr:DUF1659 domain-containing protein [Aquibacillus koreensis]MCT2537062.1 DUF1659 domain-containing protein [Aquibacillus koreensis]MDC3419955.1 DUF1659 domain-containing protein [Aquibacillus koreensis]
MAVAATIDSRLQLAFENGYDAEAGKVILKTKSFNNIKVTATPDQLLAVTAALVPLQQLPLYSIKRNDTELITAE